MVCLGVSIVHIRAAWKPKKDSLPPCRSPPEEADHPPHYQIEQAGQDRRDQRPDQSLAHRPSPFAPPRTPHLATHALEFAETEDPPRLHRSRRSGERLKAEQAMSGGQRRHFTATRGTRLSRLGGASPHPGSRTHPERYRPPA